jgi:hypothetical protein
VKALPRQAEIVLDTVAGIWYTMGQNEERPKEERMIRLKVVPRFGDRIPFFISDRDLHKYDVRLYEVLPYTDELTRGQPMAILNVHDVEGKAMRFPIFASKDLEGLYLSQTGHLILQSTLSEEQRLWMDMEKAANRILQE